MSGIVIKEFHMKLHKGLLVCLLFTFSSIAFAVDFDLPHKEWRLISLPAAPPAAENTVEKVFGDDISGVYGTSWALYEYNSGINQYHELNKTDPVKQGVGYWMIQLSGKGVTLDLPAGSHASAPSIALTSSKNQNPQWNLVGSPFSDARSLDNFSVKIANGDMCGDAGCGLNEAKDKRLVHNKVWIYNGQGYEEKGLGDTINPWEGFWIPTLAGSGGYNLSLVAMASANNINSISASDDGVNLHLKMAGNFTEGSHFGFYIDADNNPNTGYNGVVNEITGADYLVESGIFYHYPKGAHGWKWKRVSTDSTMENSSTEAQAHIPLRLLNAGSTIKYLGSVASGDWSQKAYSQMTEYQLGSLGKTLHVDGKEGSDSSDGSAQHPLKTIQAALDRVKPGERIFIKKGLYHEALDMPVSGTEGKPVIIEGEKDANGNRLVRVHGGEGITVNWQRADEIGNGVYKTTELPNTFAMTLLKDGVFKDIPRLHASNSQDRKWLEGIQQEGDTGTSYTYKDIMALPDNTRFRAYYTQLEVNYWDGIEAVYTYDNGTTYLRFRGGDDPNGLQLYRAGGDTNKNGNLRESLLNDVLQEGATFKLHNRSYITIRGLNIDGAQNGVLIYGNNAHHNVIEDNDIVNGQRRVFIAQLAHDNVVRNNKLHMELLSHYRPGAWYQAQHLPDSQKRYQYAVAEHYYDAYKREIGRSTYSPLDDCGVFVNTAGGGNDIYSNEIYDTLGGVLGGQIGDIKIHDNTFHHISSVSTGLGDGPTYIYKNRLYNVHIGFRAQLVAQEKTELKAWIFENIIYNPDRLSSGVYLSVNTQLPLPQAEDEYATIYIYHNTFVNTGRDNQATAGNVSKKVFLINNLFYKSFLSVDRGGEIGHVDYNWFGDANIFADSSPHPYGQHNIENPQDEPWQLPETFPNRMLDFSLPAGSSAVNAGLDLSRPFVLDGVTHNALYGMSEGYFSGAGPNMGAVQ
jgi:hypothetical protein